MVRRFIALPPSVLVCTIWYMYHTVHAESRSSDRTGHRRPRTSAWDRLLHDAIAYVAEHGLAELSLRKLAAAIGTSHRMLIYHFGSKEGLSSR